MKNKKALPLCLSILLVFTAAPSLHGEKNGEKNKRFGVGSSFSLGASIPKGDYWDVEPRTSVGFSLTASFRVLFGHSCTEPTIFFIPHNIDTTKEGGRNGSFLSALIGMQVYPYSIFFVQPYFMFGAGYGWAAYEGPYPELPDRGQSGTGKGVAIMVGGGIDFNLYRWFSIGPTFSWNPVWWFDCSKKIEFEMRPTMCDPTQDHWKVKFWFAGLRTSFNFKVF